MPAGDARHECSYCLRDAESPRNENANGPEQRLIFQLNAFVSVNYARFATHRVDVKKPGDLGHAKLVFGGGHLARRTDWNCAQFALDLSPDGFSHWARVALGPHQSLTVRMFPPLSTLQFTVLVP